MKESRTVISRIITQKLGSTKDDKMLPDEIAAYLLQEGRVGDLDSILRDVQQQRADSGYVEVIATSAFPLEKESIEDIKKRISGLYPSAKKITVTEVHDPEVIGGVRLSLANQQLDLSLETKLNAFKRLTIAGKE